MQVEKLSTTLLKLLLIYKYCNIFMYFYCLYVFFTLYLKSIVTDTLCVIWTMSDVYCLCVVRDVCYCTYMLHTTHSLCNILCFLYLLRHFVQYYTMPRLL